MEQVREGVAAIQRGGRHQRRVLAGDPHPRPGRRAGRPRRPPLQPQPRDRPLVLRAASSPRTPGRSAGRRSSSSASSAWRSAAACIIGMGETLEQRAELAAQLADARPGRGAAELPRPASGHAVRATSRRPTPATRCARSPPSASRCRAPSCASPAAASSRSATSAPARAWSAASTRSSSATTSRRSAATRRRTSTCSRSSRCRSRRCRTRCETRSCTATACGRRARRGRPRACRERRAATDPPRFCTSAGASCACRCCRWATRRACVRCGPLAAMTDVEHALEELRAAGLFRRAAGDGERARARACALDGRDGAAAVLERLPGAGRAPGACAPRPPRRPSAGARARGRRALVSGHIALHARARGGARGLQGQRGVPAVRLGLPRQHRRDRRARRTRATSCSPTRSTTPRSSTAAGSRARRPWSTPTPTSTRSRPRWRARRTAAP